MNTTPRRSRSSPSRKSAEAGPDPARLSDGVVEYSVQGPAAATGAGRFTPAQLVRRLQAGLAFGELETLRESLGVSMDRLATVLGLAKATLHRRKLAGRLDPAESDRVVRFARLLGKAVAALETLEQARAWLQSPQPGLGGAVPLEFAASEVGAREVEDLLTRIEYGVYA